MQKINTKPFMPLSGYKMVEMEKEFKVYLKGGKITYLPKNIQMDQDTSWFLGMWMGDNYSSKKGTKPTKTDIKTSGRLGIVNNDLNIMDKVVKVFKNMGIKNLKMDVRLPQKTNMSIDHIRRRFQTFNPNVYNGSPWRKNLGVSIYVNNTSLLRTFNHLTSKIKGMNKKETGSLISGLIDSEGTIDKSNKYISITNKDKLVQKTIEKSLGKLDVKFSVKLDKRDRYNTLIRGINDLKVLHEYLNLGSKRKSKLLKEMLNGNFVRKIDLEYLKKFKKDLRNKTTILDLSTNHKIPKPTVKMVLKNLKSMNLVKRKPNGRKYIYYI